MKFTLSWLKDHLETTATLGQIKAKLDQIGLEVEGIDDPAEKLKKIANPAEMISFFIEFLLCVDE